MDTHTIEHGGRTFQVVIVHDDTFRGAPWDEEDGHGPVSDWRSRNYAGHYDKAPGELLLHEDRGSARFYDFAEACRIARAEGWGFLPYPVKITPDDPDRPAYAACGGRAEAGPFSAYDPHNFNAAVASVYAQHRATMTARQYAAGAALADFERLRRWCAGDWCYVGVVVSPVCECCETPDDRHAESLWGIESDAGEYLDTVALELAEMVIDALEAEAARLAL